MVRYDFSDKVAFVTGAARGQGRSHARHFAKHGADVAVADICRTTADSTYELADREQLEKTEAIVNAHDQRALAIEMDVRNEADVVSGVSTAIDEFGRIDFLANNAGVAPVGRLVEISEEVWDHALDVNLKGMWLCAKHVARHMIEEGSGGRVVNTSSTAGLVASPGLGHYAAAKHGVLGLTKTLAIELAPFNITVNAVCPTAVDTQMTNGIVESIDEESAELAAQSGEDNVLGDIVSPVDVSAAFMWLSSEDARFVTGIALPVAAGATAI